MRICKFIHDTILEYSNILYAIVISIMAYLVQNFCLLFCITDSTKYTVTMLFCHHFKVSPTTNNLPTSCLSQLNCQHERCRILNRRRLICGYFIPPWTVGDVNGAGEWLQSYCETPSINVPYTIEHRLASEEYLISATVNCESWSVTATVKV